MVWCLRGIGCAQKGYHKKERGENCSYLPIMTKSEIDRPTFPGIKYIPIYIYSGHVFTPPPLVDVTTLPSPGDLCIPYPLCVPCPCAWRANFTHTFFILSASPSAVRFSVGLSACMSVYLPVCLSLPLCFSVSLSLSLPWFACLSICLSYYASYRRNGDFMVLQGLRVRQGHAGGNGNPHQDSGTIHSIPSNSLSCRCVFFCLYYNIIRK